MALEAKLLAWRQAGLIDAATAERIRAFEADAGRPLVRWAAVGLGALAIGLGLVLLVASNWAAISPAIKISVHLVLMALLAGGGWWADRAGRGWLAETLLLLLAFAVLAGIALHAQIYQLSGTAWRAVLLWLLLAGPLLVAAGRSAASGLLVAAIALLFGLLLGVDHDGAAAREVAMAALALSVPGALLLLSATGPGAAPVRTAIRQAAIVALMAGGSIAHFAWASAISPEEAARWAMRLAPGLALAGLGAFLLVRQKLMPGLLGLAVGPAPVLAAMLALGLPHADATASRLLGAFLFLGLWGLVAWAAARAGATGLFGLAVAAMGLRLFLIYVELFGSLAATGAGLVAGGLLLLLLGWGWQRVMAWRRRQAMPDGGRS